MKKRLKILHLEDSAADSELVSAMLGEIFEVELIRVDSEARFEEALSQPDVDLIISDFTLPSYDGLSALTVAHTRRPDLPFIFFSGTIGEEAAVDTLTSGATDYILKHRPQKLLAAIERAVRERAERASRVEAERALKEREEWFRAITENALDVITILDQAARFTYNSPSIERVLGYSPEELLGANAFNLVHPEDLQAARDALGRAFAAPNQTITAEFRIRHKNGSWRNLELIGKSLPPGHHLNGLVINSRDVTEKKQTEAQFLRAQRMECLGALAGGIAHDLNNILAPILMGAELLKSHVTSAEGRAMIDTIEASTQRGSDIVKQVLSFARGVKGESSKLNVKHLAQEVVQLLRETFPKSIQVQTRFAPGLSMVVGNPTELHQVLMNLCVNARDAMPDGGLLQVTAKNVSVDKKTVAAQTAGRNPDFVCITVSDSGSGIAPEALQKIFEPFYTTKEEGKGTGLGLPTVLSIVKRHGGFVQVESVVGEGTRFAVYIPAGKGNAAAVSSSEQAPRKGNGEAILLVDDEIAILEMARVILEDAGYRVFIASEGVQALQTFQTEAKGCKLVITDGWMPVMDGVALITELRQIAPHVRVICTTGESSRGKREQLKTAGASVILSKPYTAEQLLRAVADALSAAPV